MRKDLQAACVKEDDPMLEERGNEMKKETQDLFEKETGHKKPVPDGVKIEINLLIAQVLYYKTLSEWLAEKLEKAESKLVLAPLETATKINDYMVEHLCKTCKQKSLCQNDPLDCLINKIQSQKVPIETARKMNKIAFSIGIDTVMNNYEKKQIKIALKAQQEKGYVEVE